MIALVDGNNFYVSAERAFRPDLKGRAVIVVGNNDGCAIARSDEAKALGIKMGQPLFEIKKIAENEGVVCLSANFTLYGDMSNRMMSIAAGLGPHQEVYSIDESFVDLAKVPGDLTQRACLVRERILQWTGLPTCIGIGSTKTLAKLANFVAKSAERKPGSYPIELARVCHLGSLPASDLDAVLAATSVSEVWGVGSKLTKQLNDEGIETAHQLALLDPATVRRRWSVVLERTVRELQGQSCIALEDEPPPKREIAHTRSFGHAVTQRVDLISAVSAFASSAGSKLRLQASIASQVLVFAHTSPFRPGPRFSRSITIPLGRATSDSKRLVSAAVAGLNAIWKPGFEIARAGVMLLELQDENSLIQEELDLYTAGSDNSSTLMKVFDRLNDRFGRGTIVLASTGFNNEQKQWAMRRERLTPQYTTNWADIPVARA